VKLACPVLSPLRRQQKSKKQNKKTKKYPKMFYLPLGKKKEKCSFIHTVSV